MHGASADGPSLGQGRDMGRPAWKAGSAPDATRNSATAFPRSSAVPAGASAWNEDGRWTRAAGGETPHRAEPLWRHETWLWWARRQQLRTQLLPELLLRRGEPTTRCERAESARSHRVV